MILKGAIKKVIPLVKNFDWNTFGWIKKACEEILIIYGLSFISEIYSGVNNQGESNLIYFFRWYW